MILSRLGFDLAGRSDFRLRRGFLTGVLAAAVDALPYAVLAGILPALAAGGNGGEAAPWRSPWLGALLLAAALPLGVWLRAHALLDNFAGSYGLVADARLNVADHLARLPVGRVLRHRDAALAELLTSRFSQYQDIITHVWGLVVTNSALPALLWLLLAWIDGRLALLLLAVLPLAALTIPWSHAILDRAAARVMASRERAVAGVVEMAQGARDLRGFDSAGQRRAAVDRDLHALERDSRAAEAAAAPALSLYGLMVGLGLASVTLAGGLLWEAGRLEAVPFLLALLLTARLCAALTDLGVFLAGLRLSGAVLAEIRALAREPAMPEPAAGRHPVDASVTLKDVVFRYDDIPAGVPALNGIGVHLPAGSVTALVGPSGSGKSTLARLVARLWDVERGSVRIGGIDVRDMDGDTLNRTVSMVLQEVVLFDMTVADNIRLGRPDAGDAEVEAAARAACIHDRIQALPGGYATRLSDGGAALSGGERQRIAIARALLKDAPVLILDEATSSLDLDNEAHIQQAINALCRGRTVIVIAHRLWTIREVDHILVLDGGRIAQQGRHDALLAADGLYRRLWTVQRAAHDWRLTGPDPDASIVCE